MYEKLHPEIDTTKQSFGIKVERQLVSFRAYVPPGTQVINLRIYASNNERELYAVSRMDRPPKGPFKKPFFVPGNGYTLSNLRSGDCYSTNKDGQILISRGYVPEVTEQESGWIYTRIIGDVRKIKMINYNLTLNPTTAPVPNPKPEPPEPGPTPPIEPPAPPPMTGGDKAVEVCGENITIIIRGMK